MQDSEVTSCPVTGHGGPVPVDPGPSDIPLLGISLSWLKNPFSTSLRVQRDHGGVAWLRILRVRSVQVSSPTAIRRILVNNASNYIRGARHHGMRAWMGDGLITLDDPEWRQHRTVLQPVFNGDQVPQHLASIRFAVDKQAKRWEHLADTGEVADLGHESNELIARAFGKALLDKDLDDDLVRAVAIASDSIYRRTANMEPPRFLPTRYNRRKRWAQRVLDRVTAETAAARSTSDDRVDVASQILRSDLPRKAFGDNIRTIFLAGADTTGVALTWTLWELAQHPRIREEVEEEADRVLGDHEPTVEDLTSLPITRAVVDESLRLHPPIWLLIRETKDRDVLDRYQVNPRDPIVMSFYATHRCPQHWDDPDAFDHRRFLGGNGNKAHRSGAYAPFGAGKHQCVGKNLALHTLVLAIAMLARRFRIAIDGTEPAKYASRVTLHPDRPIRFTVRRR